jgi:branched-chain amino acid transport system ATP-binding protein
MTVFDNVLIAKHQHAKQNVFSATFRGNLAEEKRMRDETMDLLVEQGLETYKDELAVSLPYGLQRRLEIARALATHPKLLLLDEHTAALDPAAEKTILEMTERIVREHGLTCLMITHNMQSALDLGNRTLMMHQGRILFDTRGEERARLTVDDLLEKFRQLNGARLDNDRMLLN